MPGGRGRTSVLHYLKKGRVFVSLLLFLLILALFLDVSGTVVSQLGPALAAVQVLPSLLTLLSATGAAALGLLVVILLTLLFGRVYCSSLCPLGTLQDIVIALSRRFRGPRRFRFAKPQLLLHYALLILTITALAGGSVMVIELLDPFSNFGRIATTLVRPAVVGLNNGVAWLLGRVEVYAVAPVPFQFVGLGVVAVSLGLLGAIAVMAWFHGRLLCNTVCPVGAMLGLLARVSAFRLAFDEQGCKECGLCEKICKANCIDSGSHLLDFSRCISCFNCIDDCPTSGVRYTYAWGRGAGTTDQGRRGVLTASLAFLAGRFGTPGQRPDTVTAGGYDQRPPVTPPGSLGAGHFTGRCTACYLCVSACPTQVLAPTLLEYGITGLLQPKLDFGRSYCKYECTVCSEVCPSGAILPIPPGGRQEIQVGKALFVRDDCIVITKKTECGACSEHCPTKAVNMIRHDGLMLPEVREEICVGCGACEHACPTKPQKAIYVVAQAVHQKARRPETQPANKEPIVPQEFPF